MKPAKVLVIDRDAVATMLDHMAALADPLRCRMLLVLERHELTVSELCCRAAAAAVHGQPPSEDAGRRVWVAREARRHEPLLQHVARRSRRRRAPALAVDSRTGGLDDQRGDQDERRLKSVLARRRSKSEEFFSTASGQWDRLREELFGGTFHLHALARAARCRRSSSAISGCGTGQVSQLCWRRTSRGSSRVDGSPEMLRRRAAPAEGRGTVDLRLGTLEALPIDDAELRRGDDGAGAASRARSGARARRVRARAEERRTRAGRSTCCRTIAPSISSRWDTCGWVSRRRRCGSCCTRRGLRPISASTRCRSIADAKGPALFAAVAHEVPATV